MSDRIPQLLNSSITQSLHASNHIIPLFKLDEQTAYCILAASAFLGRHGKLHGAEHHSLFDRLLGHEVRSGGDLRSWLQASFATLKTNQWDFCRKRADECLEEGVSVFRLVSSHESRVRGQPAGSGVANTLFTRDSCIPCPVVLFGKGGLELDRPLFAVFNSRKPRLVSPDVEWFEALRFFFRSLDCREMALAGSAGTLTYDLAGTLALRCGLLRLLVAPVPLLKADRELSKVYGEGARDIPVLSCRLDYHTCHGKQAPVCRDRTLAALVNLHLVLEIRSRGNLLSVLDKIQAQSPRPQFVFEPGKTNSANAGNYTLLTKYPEYSHGFKLSGSVRLASPDVRTMVRHSGNKSASREHSAIPWGDYLFHYTRACSGPWPGESYRQYLDGLLGGCPLSGHSALETLIRIVQEGLIRAGSSMVRGPAAVVSWSSHPPQELFVMRKWNRTLARWTVEPYGVAVRRDILRSLGAKPAVYGNDQVYARLVESERYRFQLSRSAPSSSWRHEREWRLRGGLKLDKIFVASRQVASHEAHVTDYFPHNLRSGAGEFDSTGARGCTRHPQPVDPQPGFPGFVFVKTEEEKAKLFSHVEPGLSIVVLDSSL